MAIKPCRECGAQISTETKNCPQCGVGAPARNAVRARGEVVHSAAVYVIQLGLIGAGLFYGVPFILERLPKRASPPTVQTTAKDACSVRDISIIQSDWRRTNSDFVRVTGELRNDCSEPVGVRLQITFRDANHKVIADRKPWPASATNIEPGAYSFSFLDIFNPAMITMDTRVIEVRQW